MRGMVGLSLLVFSPVLGFAIEAGYASSLSTFTYNRLVSLLFSCATDQFSPKAVFSQNLPGNPLTSISPLSDNAAALASTGSARDSVLTSKGSKTPVTPNLGEGDILSSGSFKTSATGGMTPSWASPTPTPTLFQTYVLGPHVTSATLADVVLLSLFGLCCALALFHLVPVSVWVEWVARVFRRVGVAWVFRRVRRVFRFIYQFPGQAWWVFHQSPDPGLSKYLLRKWVKQH